MRPPPPSYLNWDDYFMAVAFLSSQRSKDPNKQARARAHPTRPRPGRAGPMPADARVDAGVQTRPPRPPPPPPAQVGAVIVSADNIILSIGYNGFPRGCPDARLPWAKKARSGNVLDTKYPYVRGRARAPGRPARAAALGPRCSRRCRPHARMRAGRVRARAHPPLPPPRPPARRSCTRRPTRCSTRTRRPSRARCAARGRPALVARAPSSCLRAAAPARARTHARPPPPAPQRVYVTMFPCNECAKLLIQAGMSEVVYHESKAESSRHHPALTAPLGGSDSEAAGGGGGGMWGAADADAGGGAPGANGSENGGGGFPGFGFGGGGGAAEDGSGGGGAAHVAVGAPDAGYVASRRLLTLAGIGLRQHRLRELIVINPT